MSFDTSGDVQTSSDGAGAIAQHAGRSRRTGRMRVAGLLAIAILAGGLFAASPAHAADSGRCHNSSRTCYPKMSTSWAPWTRPTSQGNQYWTIAKGTRVDMRCWTTGASRLNTSKWFYVVSKSYPFTRGYVPANAVADQIVVGRC